MPDALSPEAAVDRLVELYDAAVAAERDALRRFVAGGALPDAGERGRFRYPELRLHWQPAPGDGRPGDDRDAAPASRRAWARLEVPGAYATTVTQPAAFRAFLLEQLRPLVSEYGARLSAGPGAQEIPYPYVLEGGDELAREGVSAAALARHFPVPMLSAVGDEVADGLWEMQGDEPRPLALFDAVRVDYSLRRLVHYTGSDWRAVRPWVLLTNYQRYVDQFVAWALDELAVPDGPYERLTLPGGVVVERGEERTSAAARAAAAPWQRFQMPAWHLERRAGAAGRRPDGAAGRVPGAGLADGTGSASRAARGAPADGGEASDGVTLVNIGVGPSNAKTITDHLAVLRPHCWLMIGHCGGLRGSQVIGDYVLAHGYLRRDRILDELLPPEVPIPALAEVQQALQEAAARVTGEHGEALKRRLRTGTVVSYDDRNWELRWSQERRRINLSRAVAVDMESGTVAAQGYRLRVPYGTLLCVSDKPLHGEIKLPGAATAFYARAVGEHLAIGLATLDVLRGQLGALHSRKLRAFDEPPFR